VNNPPSRQALVPNLPAQRKPSSWEMSPAAPGAGTWVPLSRGIGGEKVSLRLEKRLRPTHCDVMAKPRYCQPWVVPALMDDQWLRTMSRAAVCFRRPEPVSACHPHGWLMEVPNRGWAPAVVGERGRRSSAQRQGCFISAGSLRKGLMWEQRLSSVTGSRPREHSAAQLYYKSFPQDSTRTSLALGLSD